VRFPPRHIVLFLACASLAGSGGCGGDDTDKERLTEERIAKERKEAARIARQEERVKQLERQLREQKRSGSGNASPPPSAPSAPSGSGSTAPAGTSHCGGGVYVNAATTCPFAQNVRNAYAQSGGGDTTVEAYSPATGRAFLMTCSGGSPHVCFGGNNAKVYFP
jgi:hypothetical protein